MFQFSNGWRAYPRLSKKLNSIWYACTMAIQKRDGAVLKWSFSRHNFCPAFEWSLTMKEDWQSNQISNKVRPFYIKEKKNMTLSKKTRLVPTI